MDENKTPMEPEEVIPGTMPEEVMPEKEEGTTEEGTDEAAA